MSSILVLPGDGIGPEIVDEALRVLKAAQKRFDLDIQLDHALVGGAAYDAEGDPLPESTLAKARAADAILSALASEGWQLVKRSSGEDPAVPEIVPLSWGWS